MTRIKGLGLCVILLASASIGTAAMRAQAERKVKVIEQVAPVYPDEAQQAGIEGNVVLEVTIEKNGELSMAKVISGHKLLQQAALDAVKQWRFANTGNTPVTIQLTLAFTLDSDPVQTRRDDSSLTNTYKVNAVYPDVAKREGIQGLVPIEVTVNEKGEVTEARAVGGNEKLRQAAVDAAKQFRFSNGSGKSVVATVTFNFVLDK